MKPKHTLLLALSLTCLVTSAGLAQDGERKDQPRAGAEGAGSRVAEMVKRADTNADGKISKEEFLAASAKESDERFSKLDANADGSVDATEISQVASKLREGMASRGAGGSSEGGGFRRPPEGEGPPRGERPEGDRPRGDGPPRGERPQGGPPQGGRPEGGPPQGGSPGMMGGNIEETFGRMDKNADGSVDMPEFIDMQKGELEGRFKRMDENSDGKVSKEEMKGALEKMRGMMQRGGQGQGQGRGPGGPGAPGGGEGGFRRPPLEGDAPKKEGGV